ncbi:hypothetical protein Q7P37_003932 [Cladosporium fusiforme]
MADEKAPLNPPPYTDEPQPAPTTTTTKPGPRPPFPLDLPALNLIRGKRIILASTSPRRRQLLAQIGLTDLEIIPSTAPENQSHALPLRIPGEPALVLAADTVVCTHLGQILEKPRNEREHVATLKMLRDGNNGWHKVYTAVVAMAPLESAADPGYAMEHHVEETAVKFDQSVTDELIVSYVRTREGADKAGGYGIQGVGSILVEKIDGTFDNVVGLPLRATLQVIESVVVEPEVAEDVDSAM